MTSGDGQSEDGVPVFRIDEEEVVDLANLLGDDSASSGQGRGSGGQEKAPSNDFSSMRDAAIQSAAESLASSLEDKIGDPQAFDDAVSALIYGGDSSFASQAPEPDKQLERADSASTKAPAPTKISPPTLQSEEREESAESTAANVFKVDLDELDDFEALLQRTMGEAAGTAPKAKAAKAAKAQAPEGKSPIELAMQAPPVAQQWKKPEKARPPERTRSDEPSQESKAVDELRKKVKDMTSETESYRRRLKDEAKAARGKGREDVFKALMPIMDALEMALKSAGQSAGQGDQLTKGIELVAKQLKTDLGLLGLEFIDPEGHPFDPNVHEAFQQVTTGKVAPGEVAEVVRNGYRFNEKLLRAAQVLVEKA